METKNYRKSTTYADFEDYKRLHFIINAICGFNNKEAKLLDNACGKISLALVSFGYHVTGVDNWRSSVDVTI